MRNRKKNAFVFFIPLMMVTTLVATLALHGSSLKASFNQEEQKSKEEKQREEFESQFPVADYSAQDMLDSDKHAKRQAKSKKYDKSTMSVDPAYESTADTSSWASGLSALPVQQSNAVITGDVINAQAYLSNDKTGVYSEFTIHIDEILKNDSEMPLSVDNSLAVERQGGRVRFPPSRKVSQYFTVGQGMPRVGRRYLFFLTRNQQDFRILTGYELRGGHVFLLDNPGAGHPIAKYKGIDEATLLSDVRTAIANSGR